MNTDDPIIDEIRRVRHEISKSEGHDPKKLVDHYIQAQKKHADKLIFRQAKKPLDEMVPVKS